MKSTIAVIGGGNGGQAFAAYLSLKGYPVRLFDIAESTVERLNQLGGVTLQGNSAATGFGKIQFATTDMEQAVKGADIIMVVLPSIYHRSIAAQMAPYLRDGQCVVLNPNASLGTFEFMRVLKECHATPDILLIGTATLLFACRAKEVGQVVVAGQKKSVSAAAHPASRNQEAAELFSAIIPEFTFNRDVVSVSLDNLRALVHTAPCIMNTGRIESGIDFQYYIDFTPTQGAVIDYLDTERMKIGAAYGLELTKLKDEYIAMYGATGSNTYEVFKDCPGYHGIMGPKTLRTRYMYEDVPFSLVAYQSLAKVADLQTPAIDAVITLSKIMLPDLEEGRTVENLGFTGKSVQDILAMCR